jgi:hypothetical protein
MNHSYRTGTLGFLSSFLAVIILITGSWLFFLQKINVTAADAALVAAYSFSESSGNTILDSSTNRNNGRIVNGAIRTTQGKYGSAINFDGINDRISIPDSSSLDLTNGMTLEAWVYPTKSMSHWSTVLMKEGNNKLIYTLYAHGEMAKQYGIIFSNGAEQISDGGEALPLNTWTHLAVTYDKQQIKLYKNAQLISSKPYNQPIEVSGGRLSIGGNAVWSNENFPGLIDEVRIYSRALTQAEIQIDKDTPIATNITPTATPTPSSTPAPTITVTPVPTITITPTPTGTPCWPSATAIGALPGQPAPVFCSIVNTGAGTSISGLNSWKDEFNHGLNFANFDNTNYRIFDTIGVHKTIHWRHANHWMVDLSPADQTNAGSRGNGGGLLSPDRTFKFENGKFIVETDYAAGIEGYNRGIDSAWGEIVVTTGDTPVVNGLTARADRLYGYDMFPNHWTLGCRFQAEGVTICSLMNNTTLGSTNGGRTWEMSFFQQVGNTTMGGYSDGSHFRFCKNTDPDMNCRDRFRLELTETSLTIYANGVKFFEQTGIPALPEEFVNGNLHVYLGSINVGNIGDTVRYHWGPMSVNPTSAPSAAPGFGGTSMNHQM